MAQLQGFRSGLRYCPHVCCDISGFVSSHINNHLNTYEHSTCTLSCKARVDKKNDKVSYPFLLDDPKLAYDSLPQNFQGSFICVCCGNEYSSSYTKVSNLDIHRAEKTFPDLAKKAPVWLKSNECTRRNITICPFYQFQQESLSSIIIPSLPFVNTNLFVSTFEPDFKQSMEQLKPPVVPLCEKAISHELFTEPTFDPSTDLCRETTPDFQLINSRLCAYYLAVISNFKVYDAGGNGNCGPLCFSAFIQLHSNYFEQFFSSPEQTNHIAIRRKIATEIGDLDHVEGSKYWEDVEWFKLAELYQINIVIFKFYPEQPFHPYIIPAGSSFTTISSFAEQTANMDLSKLTLYLLNTKHTSAYKPEHYQLLLDPHQLELQDCPFLQLHEPHSGWVQQIQQCLESNDYSHWKDPSTCDESSLSAHENDNLDGVLKKRAYSKTWILDKTQKSFSKSHFSQGPWLSMIWKYKLFPFASSDNNHLLDYNINRIKVEKLLDIPLLVFVVKTKPNVENDICSFVLEDPTGSISGETSLDVLDILEIGAVISLRNIKFDNNLVKFDRGSVFDIFSANSLIPLEYHRFSQIQQGNSAAIYRDYNLWKFHNVNNPDLSNSESLNGVSSSLFPSVPDLPELIIVEKSQLVSLLKQVRICENSSHVPIITEGSSQAHVCSWNFTCSDCVQTSEWVSSSKTDTNDHSVNIMILSSWLNCGRTYEQYRDFFCGIHSPKTSKKNFFQFQKGDWAQTVMGYSKMQKERILEQRKIELGIAPNDKVPLSVLLDSCYDSCRNAEHSTVTIMDALDHRILWSESGHRKEAYNKKGKWSDHASNLEAILAERSLTALQDKLSVVKLVNDGAPIYSTLLRRAKTSGIVSPSCVNAIDPWHFTKSLMKKLSKALSSDSDRLSIIEQQLRLWIHYVITHCEGNSELFLKLLKNAPVHWRNNQSGDHSSCCSQSPCQSLKEPLFKSNDLKLLIITPDEAQELMDFLNLEVTPKIASEVCYGLFTSYLESFHRTLLIYAPKTHNFSFSYELRIALATLDWNEHYSRAIIRRKSRSPKFKKRSHGYEYKITGSKTNNFRDWISYYLLRSKNRPASWNNPYSAPQQRATVLRTLHSDRPPCSIYDVKSFIPKPNVGSVNSKKPERVSDFCGCKGGKFPENCCNNNRCGCRKSNEPCTSLCACQSGKEGVICNNMEMKNVASKISQDLETSDTVSSLKQDLETNDTVSSLKQDFDDDDYVDEPSSDSDSSDYFNSIYLEADEGSVESDSDSDIDNCLTTQFDSNSRGSHCSDSDKVKINSKSHGVCVAVEPSPITFWTLNKITLTAAEIARIVNNQWFNDSIIDFYLKYLKSVVFGSRSSEFLFCLAACNQLVRRKKCNILKAITSWGSLEAKYIFVPINDDNQHWALLIVENLASHKPKLRFFDSLINRIPSKNMGKNYTNIINQVIQALINCWSQKYPNDNQSFVFFPIEYISGPQQNNGFDCGVFVLHFIEMFCHNPSAKIKNTSFSVTDVTNKRKRIAELVFELSV